MNTNIRPKSTPFNNRSFILDKKSSISTQVNSQSKSFYSKSKKLNESKKDFSLDTISQSVPVEIYFNPEFRTKYVKKVIDSFFGTLKDGNPQQNPQTKPKCLTSTKMSLRSRMKEWRNKPKLNSDIQLLDSGKFIRSSPKKSIFSDFSQQKSLQIIDQKTIIQLKDQIQNQLSHSLALGNQTISFNGSGLFRPFSEKSKRRKEPQNSKNINSETISVFFNQSNSPRDKMRRQVRRLVDSNKYYKEFNVFEDEKIKCRIKKFLSENNPLLMREDKISKKGIKTFWKHSKFPLTLEYPVIKSIKDMLSQQFKYGSNDLDSYMQIYPKPYYNQLFLNKNEQLIDVIVSMTNFIISCKGKILTNAFQLKNLYKLDEKQFLLKDLGCSAISETIKMRQTTINHLYPPIFCEQQNDGKWLIRPEYLSPQLIDSHRSQDYSWIEQSSAEVMSSEVWSLGCMILEMLTLIPLNSDVRCRLKTNPQNMRKGLFSVKFSGTFVDFDLLQRKQKFLQTLLNRKIEIQLKDVPVEQKVLNVLKRMLIYDPKKRIKPQKILSQLRFH